MSSSPKSLWASICYICVASRIRRQSPTFPHPGVHALYNPLFLSVGGNCEYDGAVTLLVKVHDITKVMVTLMITLCHIYYRQSRLERDARVGFEEVSCHTVTWPYDVLPYGHVTYCYITITWGQPLGSKSQQLARKCGPVSYKQGTEFCPQCEWTWMKTRRSRWEQSLGHHLDFSLVRP